MDSLKHITGNTEDGVLEQITRELADGEGLLEHRFLIQQGEQTVHLHIDIDPGGGFESGYQTTTLIAPLPTAGEFRFALHKEDFLDEIGKFFGMQDLILGYPEFDKNVVIKTNDEEKLKQLFSEATLREAIETMKNDFTLAITVHDNKRVLEWSIEKGITEPAELGKIYHSFWLVFNRL